MQQEPRMKRFWQEIDIAVEKVAEERQSLQKLDFQTKYGITIYIQRRRNTSGITVKIDVERLKDHKIQPTNQLKNNTQFFADLSDALDASFKRYTGNTSNGYMRDYMGNDVDAYYKGQITDGTPPEQPPWTSAI